MKKILLILLVVLVVGISVVYYFRQDIFQASAEAIIKKNLPPFVTVDSIIFNLKEGLLEIKGFAVKNPRGYKDKNLARIDSITCKYKMKSKNVLDGLEVTEVTAQRALINIERLADGRININEMDEVMDTGKKAAAPKKEASPAKTKSDWEGMIVTAAICCIK